LQAVELQELLMKDARETTLKAVSRAIVARAWRELEDMKRRIQGKADPKPVDVAALAAAKLRERERIEEWTRLSQHS
jgi:hypothetical protein